MAAPGRLAKVKQQKSLDGWQQIAEFFGSAIVSSPTLGKVRNASHPRGSAGARIAG